MYRACIDVCDRGAIGWQLPVRQLFTVTNGQTVRHSSDEAMLKGQISQTSPPPTTTPHIHLLLVAPSQQPPNTAFVTSGTCISICLLTWTYMIPTTRFIISWNFYLYFYYFRIYSVFLYYDIQVLYLYSTVRIICFLKWLDNQRLGFITYLYHFIVLIILYYVSYFFGMTA